MVGGGGGGADTLPVSVWVLWVFQFWRRHSALTVCTPGSAPAPPHSLLIQQSTSACYMLRKTFNPSLLTHPYTLTLACPGRAAGHASAAAAAPHPAAFAWTWATPPMAFSALPPPQTLAAWAGSGRRLQAVRSGYARLSDGPGPPHKWPRQLLHLSKHQLLQGGGCRVCKRLQAVTHAMADRGG